MKLSRTTMIIAAAGMAVSTPALAQQAGGETEADRNLPIRRISLYRSGVGYFQREGAITGDAEVQLRFATDQINDILKSLVMLDLDGGRIDAVSYGSKEPIERRLGSFAVNIADNPSLPTLLDRLRGAPVRVTTSDGAVTGTILGVERRVLPPKPDQPNADVHYLNLVTSAGIRSLPLTDLFGYEILDEQLAAELGRALAALAEYRADSSKTVDLNFAGDGSRRVVVAYVHEMPVWKTSYRLILPEPDKKDSAATIQGWAIVENVTDQDWTDVNLSLVSGRPVSFRMDLYEPLFTFRPELPVPTVPGVISRVYDQGVNERLQEFAKRIDRDEQADRRGVARTRAGLDMAPAAAPMEGAAAGFVFGGDDMAGAAAQAQGQAGQVGEVFLYELANPVTIERQHSAMIPLITADMQARRVSILNLADGSQHPMRGVEIINDTDLQFLPGPISVFDGAAYAGDAQIGHVGAGDKRLLAYSVDLDVAVVTRASSDTNVVRIKIVDGMIEQTLGREDTLVYAMENKDESEDRTVIVEHQRHDGWDLKTPDKAAETTQSHYRFEVGIPAGESESLTVTQHRVDVQRIAVIGFDIGAAVAFQRQGKLSRAVLDAIREVARRQGEINTVERSIQETDRELDAISRDQSRIRSNMSSVSANSDLYRRYVQKLDEQETQVEQLTSRRAELQAQADRLRSELNTYLRGLNVE